MKPVIILPKRCMSKKDIRALQGNDFIVVEATNPALVRFCEPPYGYSVQEKAAISLCRTLMHRSGYLLSRTSVAEMLADIIIKGTSLDQQAVTPVKK